MMVSVAAMAVLSACTPPDLTGIKLIGHGGLGPGGEHPMNSEAALFTALDRHLDGVEMDVQLTRDSVLVTHHDLMVESNGNKVRVHDLTWAQLRSLALPEGTDDTFHGVRMDEWLRAAKLRHPMAEFTFDVKLNTGSDWWSYLHCLSRAIYRLQADTATRSDIRVECRSADLLRAMAENAPGIPTFLYVDDPIAGAREAGQLGCTGISVHIDNIDREAAGRIREAGLELTIFGISNDRDLHRAAALRPERVQMDD